MEILDAGAELSIGSECGCTLSTRFVSSGFATSPGRPGGNVSQRNFCPTKTAMLVEAVPEFAIRIVHALMTSSLDYYNML